MTPCRAPVRRPARRGFTLVEVMLVVAIGAIIAMVAVPRVSAQRDASAVRAARLEIVAVTEAARAAAMQRRRPGRMTFSANVLTASVDTSPANASFQANMVTLSLQRLDQAYGVVVTTAAPGDSLIAYDARGFADPRRAAKLYVRRGSARDSVCVTQMGLILPRGCAL
jgi:prepilin-type N-terminal cleavage/methylation domain-containing protein